MAVAAPRPGDSGAMPVVVVTIHNALESLDACLASLERTLPAGAKVLLADDASPDPRINPMARGWCYRSALDARYVRREVNMGYPANCNAAFAETGEADVVLLDSDTVVTPGWLQQLARCAASDPRIATATPWSNNADTCSFPRLGEPNPAPDHPETLAEAAAMTAPSWPEIPAAAGFCMYVRRAALRQLGGFDAATFGIGGGEQDDFSLRAAAMGWRNVLCDTAYVVHRGGASFGALDLPTDAHNLGRLLARWPGYHEQVARFLLDDPLRPHRARLQENLEALQRSGPQRDLFG